MVHNLPSPAERASAIATLRAATGVATDEEAERLLVASSWNLDLAAALFLDGDTPPRPRPSQQQPQQQQQQNQVDVPRNAIRPTRIPRWIFILLSPFRNIWCFVSTLTQSFLRLIGGPARAIEAAPGNTPSERFHNFFEQRYGTTHPEFFDGGYLAALACAQREVKFLLVYLHGDSHRLTGDFVREVLASEVFVEATEGFVFWAASVTQRDGAVAHNVLRAPALPFLAVVAAPSGTVTADGDLRRANFGTVLAVRAGPPGLTGGGEGAARWLGRVIDRHGGMLDEVRRVREERESARLLREQQDVEYARALEEDREKEREAERERLLVEEERDRLSALEERRERKREGLGEEPDKGAGVASLALRLPDGSKVLRRFLLADAMEKVFDWAEVHRVDIEIACLLCSFPRRRFRYPEDAGISVKEAGLFPSAMLLLEERGEDE